MSLEPALAATPARTGPGGRSALREALIADYWPLLLGLAAMVIPSLVTLGRETWTTELGAHGPIVLVTGLWLLWQVRDEIRASAGKPLGFGALLALLVPLVVVYALARALELLFVEIAVVYAMALLVFARFFGLRGIVRNAFPFLYLAFLIPPPGYVIDALTGGLREMISAGATAALSGLGYPVARWGVSISIAQYQLLVEDACSGINSIVGLTAISLFYVYILHRASWKHAALLIALILPIAILANFIRVIVLILLTYYFGDAVGQGFAHNLAGIVLFAFALALMAGADWMIRRFVPFARASRGGAPA